MVSETEKISLGSYLKKAREEKKISLDEISSSSKINVKLLAHLEKDEYEYLPNSVFVKGYIKAYAIHLKLDSKEILGIYDEQFTPKDQKKLNLTPTQTKSSGKRFQSPKQFPKKLYWLLLGLVTLTIIIFASTFNSNNSTPTKNEVVSTLTKQGTLPTTSDTNLSTAPQQAETATQGTKAGLTSAPIPQQLTIQTIKPVWAKIQIDKHPTYTQNLVSNKELTLKGDREIKIYFSDRSAVKLTHNGKELSSLGTEPLPLYLEFNKN